jgi:hypothetical protein
MTVQKAYFTSVHRQAGATFLSTMHYLYDR